jgi:hypothetical protein
MQQDAMRELVSPQQSETLILVFTLLALMCGAAYGWKTLGARGAALLGFAGFLVYPLWRFHSYITRYDPQSGYFGLDKVRVLALEALLFIVLGAVIGTLWNKLMAHRERENAPRESA